MSERDVFPISVTDIDEANQVFTDKLVEEGTWNDFQNTNVGSFIRRMFAGLSVSHQHNILMSARNAFYGTALRDSAVYALTRGQGVYIERRISASCAVNMTNNSGSTIFVPPYSPHRVGNVQFYNPAQYFVVAGQTAAASLTQGEVRTKTFDLDAFDPDKKEFLLGEEGFLVTRDLLVYTTDKNTGNTYDWDQTQNGLFEHTGDDRVYFHSTSAKGDVSLTFGDGEFGAALPRKATLTVQYVISNGALNNGIMPGVKATYVNNALLTGETTETTSGGADHKPASYYRTYAPVMFRAREKKISADEIKAAIITYPGVADCAVLGQRDLYPDDKTWMNTMRVCVLPLEQDSWGGTNPNPKSATWQNFLAWLQPQLHDRLEVQSWNATKVFIRVQVRVAIYDWAARQATQIQSTINENLLALFRKRPGILKRRFSKSDIERAITKIQGVDYVEVISPQEMSVVLDDPTSYCVLQDQPQIDIVISERNDE